MEQVSRRAGGVSARASADERPARTDGLRRAGRVLRRKRRGGALAHEHVPKVDPRARGELRNVQHGPLVGADPSGQLEENRLLLGLLGGGGLLGEGGRRLPHLRMLRRGRIRAHVAGGLGRRLGHRDGLQRGRVVNALRDVAAGLVLLEGRGVAAVRPLLPRLRRHARRVANADADSAERAAARREGRRHLRVQISSSRLRNARNGVEFKSFEKQRRSLSQCRELIEQRQVSAGT